MYWIFNKDWEIAITFGNETIESLVAMLKMTNLKCNKVVAHALVNFYHEEVLDQQSKRCILAIRSIIVQQQEDSTIICGNHVDKEGLGVDLPL